MERLTTKQRIIRRLQSSEKRFFDGTMIKWVRLTEVELSRISAIMVRYRDLRS